MSYDLLFLRERAPPSVAMVREHAIYLGAEQANRRAPRIRNVADALERGHRPAVRNFAMLVDVKA
jgi:hypothetical protein